VRQRQRGGYNRRREAVAGKLPLQPVDGHSLAEVAAIRLRFGHKANVVCKQP